MVSRRWWLTGAAAIVAAALWLALSGQSSAEPPAPTDAPGHVANALCLACHSQPLKVDDGVTAPRRVDGVRTWAFEASAHSETACVECHGKQSAIPHEVVQPLFAGDVGVSCGECHEDAYEGYKEGPHGPVAELGDARGPACATCHGEAHYVQPINEWRETEQVAACAKCHEGAGTGFLGAQPGHRRPSAGFLSTPYFAGLFLMILTAATLAFGIVHVELEFLRWVSTRVALWRGTGSKKGASHGH